MAGCNFRRIWDAYLKGRERPNDLKVQPQNREGGVGNAYRNRISWTGWGILKLQTMNTELDGDMFRDLWHCCLLLSNPVYLMVDFAYSGCCFGGSPVVAG
jgi:hypothetical protein